MNPSQACGALSVPSWAHSGEEGTVFNSHGQRMCPRGCAPSGLCAGSKGALSVGKDTASGSSVLQLPEKVQKFQHSKRVFQWESVNSSSTSTLARWQSVFVPCHPPDPVFTFSSLLVRVQHLKKVFNIWAEPTLPFPESCLKNQPKGCVFVTKKGLRQLHIEWFILGPFRPGQMTWSPWKRASRLPCHLKTAFACMILFSKEEFLFFK